MDNIKFDYGYNNGLICSDKEELKKISKYGDDIIYNSWADNNLFYPIGNKLVDPLYNLGFTPNMVTNLSSIFNILSIYYLHTDKPLYACFSYLFGYILDCTDGSMARKYSLCSNFGMALDLTSNNISNILLFSYLFITRPLNDITKITFLSIFILSGLFSLSYGLTEAISTMKTDGTDNFYKKKVKQLENPSNKYEKLMFKLYLFITKISYKSYKKVFPNYDEKVIFERLKLLKEFGPGNYCLIIGLILLFI
jgi:phosphatidylglycerophosphate synthase